jgi:methylaspartate ammonia-lyase
MSFKKIIIKALEDKYNAEISAAEATLNIYFEKPVGIGEHPQHLEECDKLVDKMTNAEEKLQTIQKYKI